MIKDFRKTEKLKKKIKMVSLVFFDILQLPHTEISNSEKLTHPTVRVVCPQVTVHQIKYKRWSNFFSSSNTVASVTP